jgi:hypothetical protein
MAMDLNNHQAMMLSQIGMLTWLATFVSCTAWFFKWLFDLTHLVTLLLAISLAVGMILLFISPGQI